MKEERDNIVYIERAFDELKRIQNSHPEFITDEKAYEWMIDFLEQKQKSAAQPRFKLFEIPCYFPIQSQSNQPAFMCNEDGSIADYDGRYDVLIHCDSPELHDAVLRYLAEA